MVRRFSLFRRSGCGGYYYAQQKDPATGAFLPAKSINVIMQVGVVAFSWLTGLRKLDADPSGGVCSTAGGITSRRTLLIGWNNESCSLRPHPLPNIRWLGCFSVHQEAEADGWVSEGEVSNDEGIRRPVDHRRHGDRPVRRHADYRQFRVRLPPRQPSLRRSSKR